MLFNFLPTTIEGCYEIQPRVLSDHRGKFVKLFHSEAFRERGLVDTFDDINYSVYRKDVVRGLHYQRPPHASAIVVSSVRGTFLAVVVDLRKDSDTYHKVCSTKLDASTGNMLYVPEGLAHGFLSLDDNAVLLTLSTKEQKPEFKGGINWRSIDFEWPVIQALVSEEDHGMEHLPDYVSPF